MKLTVRHKLFIISFAIMATNVALGYAVYRSGQKLLDAEQWVEHTQQVIIQASKIRSLGREMQITSRDFLITDDSAFLEPLNHSQIVAFSYIGQLKQLTRDNPVQQKLIDSLNLYMRKLKNFSSETIDARKKQGLTTVIAYTADKQRKRYTNRINQVTNAIQGNEDILLKLRQQNYARYKIVSKHFTVALFILMAGLAVVLLIVAGKYLFQNKEKIKRAAELGVAQQELSFENEEKVKRTFELKKVNRLYAFLSQVNQNILHVKDEGALFKNACKIAHKFGHFKIAWIGLFDDDYKKVTITEHTGITDADAQAFKVVSLTFDGPQEFVLRNGNYYLCNDVLNDPALEAWQSLAKKYDVRSCMVLPIRKSGNIRGTFNLYSADLNLFNNEEIALLVELAGDISFALDLFEKEKIHNYTQELVARNEKRFRSLIEKSADMITLSNKDGEIFYDSPSITKVLGYSMEEYLDISVADIIHPDDVPGYVANRNKVLKTPGQSFHYELRRRHKNGSWIWCEGTVTNMLHEPGVNALVSNFRDISEKKITEQQREFDKNNLDALINNTEDLMWSVDKNCDLITANHPFDEFINTLYSEEVSNGSSLLVLPAPAEQMDQYKNSYKRALAGESFSEEIYNAGPVETWSEISYCPIRAGDKVIGTACHSRNITERKKAEEALLLTQFAVDNGGDAVFWITRDARIVKVNEATCLMLGYTQEEMMGLYVQDIDHYYNAKNWAAHFEELSRENSLIFDTKQKTKDGRLIPVEIRANYIKFGDQEFNCAFGRDISERRIAEDKLVKSETELKKAQAIAHIGSFEIDMVQYAEVWSDQMCAILGVQKKPELPSESFSSYIHPDDLDASRKAYNSLQNSSMDYRLIRKDGTLLYVNSEWKFEFDKNKKPIRLHGTLQDITERKLGEIERSKIVTELTQRNKDLEQFAYIVSHNLRAPVANIIGASTALKETGLTKEEKAILNKGINTSVLKIDEVIYDLNRILQVKSTINETKELVNFSGLVDDIKASISQLVEKNEVEIKYDFPEVNEYFTIKPYLYSIFLNLISNSVKYRRPGNHCVIEIMSHLLKDKIELTFRDNGMGIDLDKKGEQVFGLYKRFHPNTEGKGVGLFMVKTQVESLGGKISVKSKENVGTEFLIELDI